MFWEESKEAILHMLEFSEVYLLYVMTFGDFWLTEERIISLYLEAL